MTTIPLYLIMGSWALFLVFWALNWGAAKPTAREASPRDELAYRAPLIIAALLLGFGQNVPYPLNIMVLPHLSAGAWIGGAIAVVGALLAVWSRVSLGRNWSADVVLKQGHELVERGPYAYMRHPIYTAVMLMFIGTVLVIGTLAGLLSLPFAFWSFWIKLRQEEKLMLAQFPGEYPSYMRRVKRLVPFIF